MSVCAEAVATPLFEVEFVELVDVVELVFFPPFGNLPALPQHLAK